MLAQHRLQEPSGHLHADPVTVDLPEFSGTPNEGFAISGGMENWPAPQTNGFSLGLRYLEDGARFLLFFILSCITMGFIIAIAGFYVAALIIFPFVELPTLYKISSRDWSSLNSFFGGFF